MRWRSLRITLFLVQVLWLNVIVPGHRRGEIALPGENCESCQTHAVAHDCCQSHSAENHSPKPAKGDPALHCAICYFAARVTPPDKIDLTPPPLRFLNRVPSSKTEICISIATLPTYDGRGPPPTA